MFFWISHWKLNPMNLRTVAVDDEPLALKLEYLAAEDGLTKREVVEAALEDYLAREFKRRGISE